jgi:hypothetical protein
LHSATASYLIPSTGVAAGSTFSLTDGSGLEGYLMDVDTLGGGGPCTITPTLEYNGGAGLFEGGKLTTNFKQIATCTGTAPATSDNDQIKVTERASIKGSTPAASDYTDTITVVGAGNF